MEFLYGALGALFANWLGVLLLAAAAALIVITWNWRIALGLLMLLYLGVASLLVSIHQAPAWVVTGYLVAMGLAVAILALATKNHEPGPSQRQATNWLLRTLILGIVAAAWWFLDPGFAFPQFSRPETDLLLWIGICGLMLLALSNNPTYVGIGLLMWSAPIYAVATVLMPGSGVAQLVGIAALLVALACGYLALLEPVVVRTNPMWWRGRRTTVVHPITPTPLAPPAAVGAITATQLRSPAGERTPAHMEAAK
ncbi:MAG: hypothetical protein IPK16_06860 [Anaerolineales bacterium]|nr:hypothetical protein [Anaerolineales bacterium]